MDGNHVLVNRKMETNISGCFACGDITGTPYQYIKSAGEGNVAALSAMLGIICGYSKEDLTTLTMGALLHDVGKLDVNINILNKPGTLNDNEFEVIRNHPEAGWRRLCSIYAPGLDMRMIASIAYQHHEHLDGHGYPRHLTRDNICEFARIVAIADVYDAMTSNRCYRSALCPFDVISNFEQEGINKYHPKYILTFLEKIANSYINSEVLLSNDKIARIIYITNKLTRPVVQLKDSSEFINLEEHPEIYIQAII